jgi:hypothetical protein
MLACDAPGPHVTKHAAARPVSLPAASAMLVAAASWRVVIRRRTSAPGSRSCRASSTGGKLSLDAGDERHPSADEALDEQSPAAASGPVGLAHSGPLIALRMTY